MKFLKEWGGWITTFVTVVVFVAIFIADQKSQAEDMEEVKQTLHEIREFMDKQLTLNGQIIMYMEMDSE
jgi:hypothetical protein